MHTPNTNSFNRGRRNGKFGNDISNEEYQAFKAKALEQKLVRMPVLLSELRIMSETKIAYDGVAYTVTDDAFMSFVKVLGLTKQVMGNFESALGKGGRDKIIDVMRIALSGKEGKNMVTLVFNVQTRTLVDIRKDATSVLSTETYFSLFEDIMNGHSNMHVKRLSLGTNGSVEISAINSDWEFQIAKLNNEFFHSGITFINKPNQTVINPFMERLVCTNGMVISETGNSIILRKTDQVSLSGFYDQARNLANPESVHTDFKARVIRMMKTVASYGELHQAYDNVKFYLSLEDTGVMDTLNGFLPMNAVRAKYVSELGIDLEDMPRYWKRAETNMTVWQVVNGLTDISSHPEKYGITFRGGDRGVFALQKAAGELAFKKEFDLETEIPTPFDTRTRIAKDFEGDAQTPDSIR